MTLYLTVSPQVASLVLVYEEEWDQRPIYYTNRVYRGAESRYPSIEQLGFALVVTMCKLRPYFKAHPIWVLTETPLKKVLQRPNASSRLMNWALELTNKKKRRVS